MRWGLWLRYSVVLLALSVVGFVEGRCLDLAGFTRAGNNALRREEVCNENIGMGAIIMVQEISKLKRNALKVACIMGNFFYHTEVFSEKRRLSTR